MADPFPTTRWSLVLAAQEPGSPSRRAALDHLGQAYWFPLYAYVRRRGFEHGDAQDRVQSFFVTLLEDDLLNMVSQERGRFRSFLLHALKYFLSNESRFERAQKRGGGAVPLSIDSEEAARLFETRVSEQRTPEEEFRRQWTRSLIDRAFRRLREEAARRGSEQEFDVLRELVTGPRESQAYAEAAEQLGLQPGALRARLHRLRTRFGTLLRQEVSDTVRDEADVDREIRELFGMSTP